MERAIKLNKNAYEDILAHAKEAYPEECCGVLLGTEETGISEIHRLENHSGNAALHFQTDPIEIYHLERESEKRGLSVLGFYHSHPDHEAVTSEEDKYYMIPELVYLIVRITGEGTAELRSYRNIDNKIIGQEVAGTA